MPQFDFTTLASQLFWLMVFFGVLYGLMSRLVLPRVASAIEERSERVDRDRDRATEMKHEAEDMIARYNAALSSARAEATALLASTQAEVKAHLTTMHESLSQKLGAAAVDAEQRIRQKKAKALENVKAVASEVAVCAFEKITGQPMDNKQAAGAVEEASKRRAA